VVFDVDGTLYRQRRLQMQMALTLLQHCVRTLDGRVLRILSAYRKLREKMGDEEIDDFNAKLLALTAEHCGCDVSKAEEVALEWMEERPLPFLARHRYADIDLLFDGLRQNGKKIGIFSDYPAHAKLKALALQAEFVVSAGDTDVGVLKPNPKGLLRLLSRAGVAPEKALMIGDRTDRDGAAAQAAGVRSLIRSASPIDGWETFKDYQAGIFLEMRAKA
jgi:putative hydrolase of the HAD superfamily